MDSLTTAYDLVIVECGPAEPASLKRLASGATEVIISVIEEEDAAIASTEQNLKSVGYEQAFLVTPVGYVPPRSPTPDARSAA